MDKNEMAAAWPKNQSFSRQAPETPARVSNINYSVIVSVHIEAIGSNRRSIHNNVSGVTRRWPNR